MVQSSKFKADKKYKKPHMNPDECRYFPVSEFSKTIHCKVSNLHSNCTLIACKAIQQEPLRDINNELRRTETNSGHSEFVRVRISSLLISVVRLLFAPAPERAPPELAVHLRMSRMRG